MPERVKALLAPEPVRSRGPLVVFTVLLALCCVSLAEAAHDTEKLFEHAMHANTAGSYSRIVGQESP